MRRLSTLCLALAGLLLAGCASTPAPIARADTTSAARASAGSKPNRHDVRLRAAAPSSPSPLVVPLDAATLAALPREAVTAHTHGRSLRCSGVAVLALLRRVGALPSEPVRGKMLARYVQVDARDGYRVVFSLAELDPTLGNRKAWLVDRCGDAPLSDEEGPLRLIVPDDAHPARWVRQVTAITVIAAP